MTINSGSYELHEWQTREFVDSWLARDWHKNQQPLRDKLAALLPFQPENIIRVLDIGAGDGSLSLAVLGAYPKAQLVCHDFSEAMLDRARERLEQFLEAVIFVQGDLRDPAWMHAIEGKFDAVVSSIAIHNVADDDQGGSPERIREIYGEVFSLVKPGGCFLNYDLTAAPSSAIEKVYYKERFTADQAKLKVDKGIEKSLREFEQEFQERRRNSNADLPKPGAQAIANQLEWLRQAGFDEVDCFWKDRHNAIFGGFRH